jgi:cytochrome c-type biogenesis protein CcmH/NrfF
MDRYAGAMRNEPARRRGAPIGLWVFGVLLVGGGLIVRSNLIGKARSKAHASQLFDSMIGHKAEWSPNYGPANAVLWVVAIGVLLLAVALIVQLVRRP